MVTDRVFKRSLQELAELYGQRPLSPFVGGIYASAVDGWSDKKFIRVCGTLALKCKFFPKPADFVEAGGGSDSDQAQEAWNRVYVSISAVGRYQSVDLGPETNLAVRAVGGWIKLCESAECELRHVQRHFLAAFATAARAGYRGHDDSPLWGLSALDSQRMGLEPPEPFRWLPSGELEKPRPDPLPRELEARLQRLETQTRVFALPSGCPRSPSNMPTSARRRYIHQTIQKLAKKMG